MLDRAAPALLVGAMIMVMYTAYSPMENLQTFGTEGTGTDTTFSNESTVAPARSAALQPQGTVWDSAHGHTLTRQNDGHYYASALVDGRSVRMMVDTGASVIALTGRDAAAIGLEWNASDVRPVARGASGPVYGVRTKLREVEIGGIKRQNVSAMIIPEGLDISLLGQSYLSQMGSVEIKNGQMVLSEN